MASPLLLPAAFLALLLLLPSSTCSASAEPAVLTLDAGNFSEVVAAHQFIVVDFYAPWCYWSKKLAPEYEKAASILRNHDPPIVLAKIDAHDEKNKNCTRKYHIQGYPTVRFFRDGGITVQDYIWERDADSIVQYLMKQVGIVQHLKKQVGPASTEIKSAEDAASSITHDNGKGKATAILFLRSSDGRIRDFKDQFFEAIKQYSPKNLGFTMVDVSSPQVALQYFKLKESDVPLIFIFREASTTKYMKPNVEPDQILPWFKEYVNGTLEPYHSSDPIPEVNSGRVKKVAANNLNDVIPVDTRFSHLIC